MLVTRLSRALKQYNKRAVYCMVCNICEGLPLSETNARLLDLVFCVSLCLWLITSVVLSRHSVLHSCLLYHIYTVVPLFLFSLVPLFVTGYGLRNVLRSINICQKSRVHVRCSMFRATPLGLIPLDKIWLPPCYLLALLKQFLTCVMVSNHSIS